MRHTLLLALLTTALSACTGARPPTPAPSPTAPGTPAAALPSPFGPEDNVVPVALDPNRPAPPPPSAAAVARLPPAP